MLTYTYIADKEHKPEHTHTQRSKKKQQKTKNSNGPEGLNCSFLHEYRQCLGSVPTSSVPVLPRPSSVFCSEMFPFPCSALWCGCWAAWGSASREEPRHLLCTWGLWQPAASSSHRPTAVPVSKCHGNPVGSKGSREVGEQQVTKWH